MSSTVPIAESAQPPRQAAITEITVPAAIDISTTSTGPSIEVRAPTIRRLSRSRPWLSNPSRYPEALNGPTNWNWSCEKFGSCGRISGPKIARNTAIETIAQHSPNTSRLAASRRRVRGNTSGAEATVVVLIWPVRSRGAAPDRDPRVEHRVQQVDERVGDHERGDEHQRDPLDDRGALGQRRLHERRADPVEVERLLDDGRQREQRRDRDPDDGRDRDRGVAQHVAADDQTPRDPTAGRGLNVLLRELGAHGHARDPHDDRKRPRRQRDRRQRQVLDR